MAHEDPEHARRIAAIKASTSYRQAHLDSDFMRRQELRPVRLELELMKPDLIMREQGVVSTIVVFGGTRLLEKSVAQAQLTAAEGALAEAPGDAERQRAVRIAKRIVAKSRYYGEAKELARLVSGTCQRNGDCDYVIVTGGGPGIMEAANRGAHEIDAKSIGLNITLPHEQEPNSYITPELCFEFKYFAIRKMHFLMRAKAMVAFPGGFGTMDELFETLTLIQTQRMAPMPVLLFGAEYWNRLIDWEAFVEEGTVAPRDIELIQFVERAEEAWRIIADFYEIHPQPKLPRGQ